MQDSKGFLWVCTDDGLARFDGRNFKVYRSKDGLLSNYPIDIAEAEDGTLWIGSWKGGVNYLKNDSVYTPTIDKPLFRVGNIEIRGDRMILSDGGKFHALLYQKKGAQWQLFNKSADEGLFIKGDSAIIYDKPKRPSNKNYRRINGNKTYLTTDQSMLIFRGVEGLWKLQNDTTFTPFYPELIKKDTIFHVSQDAQQRYWLGGQGKIFIIDPNGGASIFTKGLPAHNIYCIKQGLDGKIYFLTGISDLNRRGLYSYDPATQQLENLKAKYNLNTDPSWLEVDQEGNLWLTTSGDGLYCITYSPFKNYEQQQGLANSFVERIIEDKYGDIYVGTINGLYRLQQGGFERVKLFPNIVSTEINDLYFGPDNELLALVQSNIYHRIQLFEIERGRPRKIVPYVIYKQQFLDRQKKQWFARDNYLFTAPFNKMDEPKSWRKYKFAKNFLIQQLFEYQNKHWMATNQGVYVFRENKQTTKPSIQLLDSIKVADGLLSNFVNTATKGQNGELWLGTKEGLFKFQNGKVTSYATQVSSNCNSILVDHRGHLWIGTSKGLSYFDGHQFIHYNHKNGLTSPGINHLFLDSHQRLWIGTSKGVSTLDLNQYQSKAVLPPKLYIHKMLINNTLVTPSKHILLKYNQELEMHFQALTFVHPEGTQYQFRLNKGQWQETSLNFVKYNRLPIGEHLLEVRARKYNSKWSTIDKYNIEVAPPYWFTWWAIGLYCVLIVLVIYDIVTRRYNKLERDKLRLEKLVDERTYELAQQKEKITYQAEQLKEMDNAKSRFFSNISHEFKTPLTLIIGPAEKLLMTDQLGPVKTNAEYILGNARRLMKLINQLMDMSKMDSHKMTLQMTTGNLTTFLSQIFHSFEWLAQQKDIQMELSIGEAAIIGNFDEDKVEKIFFNLLSNALKFTPEKGCITLSLKQRDDKISITVSDNGLGIASDRLPFIFDRFYQADSSSTRNHEGTGIGLALVKELVDFYQGTIEVVSQPHQGTTFTVVLPFVKTTLNPATVDHLSTPKLMETVGLPAMTNKTVKQTPKNETSTINTVLIVEDNDEIRAFIALELEPFYQVLSAQNGKEGIDLALKNVPDLIISDVMLPKVDGFELVKTLKENSVTSHVPIIILSAKSDFESKITGLEMGGDDYLTKPFSAQELLLRIHNILERRDRIRDTLSQMVSMPKLGKVSPTKKQSSREEAFLKKATEIVEQNIKNTEFDVNCFCREMGMSRSNLFRKIKALTDMSIVEFVRAIKLKRAAELLTESSDKIENIALESGFSDISYFNKCFKQQFGVTPSKYQ